ncbi:MAG TPA: CAP domain-containing protein [Solirubrobacteraceae bacterium]|nr:CAP domain-containing protein [Solirubrobacteraceae bacterium]
MRHRALLASIAAAASLGLAGCGASGDDARRIGGATTRPPAPAGPLSLGVTDARLGDATADSSGGPEVRLSPGGRIDPAATRPAPHERDGIAAGASCPGADLLPDARNLVGAATSTLCLLNGERADRGLVALRVEAELQRAALGHAGDMVEHRFFSHTGLNGSQVIDRIRATGYLSGSAEWAVGENLAWGTGALGTPRAIVTAWMGSAGHRDNVLRAGYRGIGLGLVAGNPSDGTGATYAAEFGAVRRVTRDAALRPSAGTHARRAKSRAGSRASRARVALSPRSRRGRIIGRVAATARAAGLGTS